MRVGVDGQCLSAAQVPPALRRFVWQAIAAFARGSAGWEIEVLTLDPAVTAALEKARIRARTASLPPALDGPTPLSYPRRVNAAFRAAWMDSPPDVLLMPDLVSPEAALIEPFGGLPLVAILADLPGKSPAEASGAARTARRATRLRDAGAWFLVTSLHLRDWLTTRAGVSPDRIETLPPPIDLQRFRPPDRDEARRGKPEPFVLTLGCEETQPHLAATFRAHAGLGASLKKVKLVVAADLEDRRLVAAIERAADEAQADPDSWRMEPDETGNMAELCRAAKVFLYCAADDYIGTPLLEALASGCPTICSDSGALPELAGTAALTGPADDELQIGERLGRWLRQEHDRLAWAAKGPPRAKKYEVRQCAARLLQSFHQEFIPEEPETGDLKLAYVSPLPPATTGVAHYSKCMVRELREHANVDLYAPDDGRHDPILKTRFQIFPIGELASRYSKYDLVVYNMGNNLTHHRDIFTLLTRYPGVTILHDPNLHGFFYSWHKERTGRWGALPGPFTDPRRILEDNPYYAEMSHCHGAAGAQAARAVILDGLAPDEERMYLNHRITQRSRAVIVHSRWAALKLLENGDPSPTLSVPLGAQPDPQVDQEALREFRETLQAKGWKFTIAMAGFLTPNRRLDTAFEALAHLRNKGIAAGLALIGEVSPSERTRMLETAQTLGLADEALFTGYIESHESFLSCLAACDVVLNFRRPSAGESSYVTRLAMSLGKPVLATESTGDQELPESAVFRIAADDLEGAMAAAALEAIARRPELRQAMGEAGRAYVAKIAAWPNVARQLSAFLYSTARRYRYAPPPA